MQKTNLSIRMGWMTTGKVNRKIICKSGCHLWRQTMKVGKLKNLLQTNLRLQKLQTWNHLLSRQILKRILDSDLAWSMRSSLKNKTRKLKQMKMLKPKKITTKHLKSKNHHHQKRMEMPQLTTTVTKLAFFGASFVGDLNSKCLKLRRQGNFNKIHVINDHL